MLVGMVVYESQDRTRMERATTLAGLALGRYGLRDAQLHPLSHGFKEIFLVESSSRGRFVLRMYAPPPAVGGGGRSDPRYRTGLGLRSPETIGAQLHWLAALGSETDLAVPEPVPLPEGSLVGRVSFADLPPLRGLLRRASARHRNLYRPDHPPRHFSLLSWVPGENRGDPTDADLARVGRLAARLHEHAEGYQAPDPSALPRWDWCWPFGETAPLWKEGEAFYSAEEMEVFEEASRYVRADLDDLGRGDFGPIHRDLTLKNLLIGGPDAALRGTAGATDFDQCGLGHYLFDLSVVLRALRPRWRQAGRPPELAAERVWEPLLAGYESVRGLPPEPGRFLGTFDVMQRVAAVNRTLELRAAPGATDRERGERFLYGTAAWLQRTCFS